MHTTVQDQEREKIKKMAKSPLRTDLELLGRLTSKNPLLPLPDPKQRHPQIAHAPKRNHGLSTAEKKVCVKTLEKLNNITISSNHNIHKNLCGLCFWASDPLIERF